MGKYVQNIDAAPVVVDGGDEPVGVGEIKNGDRASAGDFDLELGVNKARQVTQSSRSPAHSAKAGRSQ
jgi:hypothetical protein